MSVAGVREWKGLWAEGTAGRSSATGGGREGSGWREGRAGGVRGVGAGRGAAAESTGSGTSRFRRPSPPRLARALGRTPRSLSSRPRGRLPCAHSTGKETEE